MNAVQAMRDTVKLAFDRRMPVIPESSLGYDHVAGMLSRMLEAEPPMSYGKQCRWLGWAQCAVVASGIATLDDMKTINQSNSED